MVLWAAILGLMALAVNGQTSCNLAVKRACVTSESPISITDACNSTVFSINYCAADISRYVSTLINQNWVYLLLSSNFGSYRGNRKGFSGLYRILADECWEDSTVWAKFMAKRGVTMYYDRVFQQESWNYKVNEIESFSLALDMQKTLLEQLGELRRLCGNNQRFYDSQLMHFIDDKFLDKYVSATYHLSGYVNELYKMLRDTEDPSLSFFMFDAHLREFVNEKKSKKCKQHCVFCSC